jgi:hypothetical protein
MSTKPKFFLLDAGPIIELHKLGRWNDVLDRAEIIVPRVIAESEAKYWIREDNSTRAINTLSDAEAGRLTVLDCEEIELRRTLELFDQVTQQSVDPGELHALTLLRRWQDEPRPAFCSGDRMAVVSLCLLGFSESAVSVEELLSAVGLSAELKRQFTSTAMSAWIEEGRRRFVQRSGLV